MYFEARDKTTHEIKGYSFCCHGCGVVSKMRRQNKLPPRWVERDELHYNEKGRHYRGSGFVVNFYCYGCHMDGVTARTVAATTKKFYRSKKRREVKV